MTDNEGSYVAPKLDDVVWKLYEAWHANCNLPHVWRSIKSVKIVWWIAWELYEKWYESYMKHELMCWKMYQNYMKVLWWVVWKLYIVLMREYPKMKVDNMHLNVYSHPMN